MGLLLLLAGVFFGLIFILNAIVQTMRKQTRIGFFQTLLTFLVVLLSVLALVSNQLSENPIPLVSTAALILAGLLVVLSLMLMLFELRRPDRLKQSRGVMGIGAGLLLVIATFSVPLSANIALNAQQSTATPIVVAAAAENTAEADTPNSTVVVTRTPTPTFTPTSTPTRKPRPTITPVATRFEFVTRTPLPTATLPNPCLALANYNINLRAKPEADADVLTTIPYNNTVTLFGRNADSSWWYGEYDGKSGWVKGEFISPSSSCTSLPERAVP